jgi:hypothetical protein
MHLKLLVSFLLIAALSLFAQDSKYLDVDPMANTIVATDTTPSSNFPFPTLFNWNYSTIPGVNAGTTGAMFFNDKYYFPRWNSNMLYRYNGDRFGITTFSDSATYQGSIRDLTTDGTFLYGSPATTLIHRMNAAGISQGTITSAGGNVRALAYSADENVFFVSDFSNNIGVINATTGALVRTLTGTSTLTGKYGMGYSNVPGDVPAVWVWGQGTTADPYNKLTKLNPQTGAVLATYQFGPLPPGATSPVGIAGGANVCLINDYYVLLLNYQNYALGGYLLSPVPVPVELTSFTGAAINNTIQLNWSTAAEVNSHGFEVERKSNGVDFHTIGFVSGSGTTIERNNYTYIDDNVNTGNYSYRLRMVDVDGKFEYSDVIEVEFNAPSEFILAQNYPNPFNPATKIEFSLAVEAKVKLTVYNILGENVVELLNETRSSGNHFVNFDAGNLNSGVYFYKVEANGVDGNNFSSVKKMILTK